MTSTALLRKLGRVQYTLASAPLHAIDRVGARYLAPDSTVRTTLERGVGALDAAADRLLGAATPDEPAQSEHAPPPPSAGHGPHGSHQMPAGRRDQGESTEDAPAPSDAPQPVEVDETERVADETERVAEGLLEELEEAPLAGELAEAPEDEKERMAELRAKHLVEEFEAEQRARHAEFEKS